MIDDDALEVKIRSLRVVELDSTERAEKAARTRRSLEEISLKDGANPPDARTGALMSDATRQEIYDACMAAADELIGDVEEESA